MARPRLVKLVRDRVGGFLPADFDTVDYRTINDRAAYIDALRAKLLEEVGEYLRDPSLGELADVYEVVHALAAADLDVPWQAVEREAKSKRQERGGFLGAVGMYVETTAPARHEPVAALPPNEGSS